MWSEECNHTVVVAGTEAPMIHSLGHKWTTQNLNFTNIKKLFGFPKRNLKKKKKKKETLQYSASIKSRLLERIAMQKV